MRSRQRITNLARRTATRRIGRADAAGGWRCTALTGQTLLAGTARRSRRTSDRTIARRRRIPATIASRIRHRRVGLHARAVATRIPARAAGTGVCPRRGYTSVGYQAIVAIAVRNVASSVTNDIAGVFAVSAVDDCRACARTVPARVGLRAVVRARRRTLRYRVVDAVVRGRESIIPAGSSARTRLCCRAIAVRFHTDRRGASDNTTVSTRTFILVRALCLSAREFRRAGSQKEQNQRTIRFHRQHQSSKSFHARRRPHFPARRPAQAPPKTSFRRRRLR